AISSIISYSILKKVRMHYISRITLNYILISITIVFGIMLFQWLPLGFDNFNRINPLAIVSIAALSDFFIKMYVKKSIAITTRVLLETVIVAIIGWYFINSSNLINYIIYNLWFIPLLILVNLAIGLYTGLRVKELFRFWYIAKDDRNSKKV
ncbi:MAG TPA: hypothetical protein VHA74_01235, partial [Candidatus Dojkabacteria bacterium]|nr:hypothetical protein [Candidatus Dojkabacteria bacterium]